MFKPWVLKYPRLAQVVLGFASPFLITFMVIRGAYDGLLEGWEDLSYEWVSLRDHIRFHRELE